MSVQKNNFPDGLNGHVVVSALLAFLFSPFSAFFFFSSLLIICLPSILLARHTACLLSSFAPILLARCLACRLFLLVRHMACIVTCFMSLWTYISHYPAILPVYSLCSHNPHLS